MGDRLLGRFRKAYVIIASSVALVLTMVGTWVVWDKVSHSEEGEAFCFNLLSKGDVESLSLSEGATLVSEDTKSGGSSEEDLGESLASCGIYDQSSNGSTHLARIEVETAWQFGPYRPEPISANWYYGASPLGSGLNGWTESKRSVVWLPDSCSKPLKSGGKPVQVRLELEGEQSDVWKEGSARDRMGKVLMKFAESYAKKAGCADSSFVLSERVPGASEFKTVPGTDQCGLPGFQAVRKSASADSFKNRISGSVKDGWSCFVSGNKKDDHGRWSPSLLAFAATENEQLMGEYRSHQKQGNSRSSTVSCGDRKVLLMMAYGDGGKPPENKKGKGEALESLKPQDDLFKEYTSAMEKKLGCG